MKSCPRPCNMDARDAGQWQCSNTTIFGTSEKSACLRIFVFFSARKKILNKRKLWKLWELKGYWRMKLKPISIFFKCFWFLNWLWVSPRKWSKNVSEIREIRGILSFIIFIFLKNLILHTNPSSLSFSCSLYLLPPFTLQRGWGLSWGVNKICI